MVGERAGVQVFAPNPGTAVGVEGEMGVSTGDPVQVARGGVEYARANHFDTVIIDTAGRLGLDDELMRQATDVRSHRSRRSPFVVDASDRPGRRHHGTGLRRGRRVHRRRPSPLDGDARGGAALSVRR